MHRLSTVRSVFAFNSRSVGSIVCVCGGVLYNESSSSTRCLMEGTTPINNRSKRRRPPTFGSIVPKISTRGIVTTGNGSNDTSAVPNILEDREDCPMCKKFSKGPCGNIFKQWLACTDKYPGKDASGEPLHLNKCSYYAETLAKCLDSNTDYYTKEDDNTQDTSTKNDWQEFVKDMEDGIESGEYNMQPFPRQESNPSIQVSSKTGTGVCFFNSKMNGKTIIAAYVLDDNGDVKAAGSKEDMNVQGQYMLQLKASNMKSATIRAIYDARDEDTIEIYTRTIQL